MGRKAGTILSFFVIALELVSALVVTPFLIKSFGQAEYGVYTLVLSITSYLALLDLGVGNAVVRFVVSYKTKGQTDDLRKFMGITTLYYLIVGGICFAIGIVMVVLFPTAFATGLTSEEIVLAQKLLIITTLNIVVTLATAGFYYTIIAHEHFLISKGVTMLLTVVRLVLTFVALACGQTSLTVTTINMVCQLVTRVIMVLYVLKVLKIIPKFKGIEKKRIVEIVSFSTWILLQMIATQINSMADSILIGALVQSASVILAVYSVGATIRQYLHTFSTAITSVLMPGVVRLVETGADSNLLEEEMVRIGRIVFSFVACIYCCFLVNGKEFIALWAGNGYDNSYYVAIILMFPSLFILPQNIGTQILWAKNKHKVQSILKFSIVILNVILTVALIKWNALFGAVIGTFISLMIGDVLVMQFVFVKDIGINLKRYYLNSLKGIFIALVVMLVSGMAFRNVGLSGWFGLLLNCSIMVISYALVLWFYGFNTYEKNLILSIIRKTRKIGHIRIEDNGK